MCNGLSNPEHAEFVQHLRAAGQLGRDFLSRLIHGARLSLFVGLAATTLHVVVAALVGGGAGFLGGKFDLVVQRFVDAWMSMPGLLVLLTIMSLAGRGLLQIILVLGINMFGDAIRDLLDPRLRGGSGRYGAPNKQA